MTLSTTLAFCLFAFVASITPGPNNLMLLASGMNFGFRASIRHILGISSGFFVMVIAVGLGLGEVFARYPTSYAVMKWVGIAYLLYLAWRIATSAPPSDNVADGQQGKPLGFWGAASFQWVNPKAWAMAISAFSTYIPAAPSALLVIAMSGLFAAINLPCVAGWALFGARLKRWLREPQYARIINASMALLLVASLLPIPRIS
jgi:threonine/homoserine/homoserine lactone efflux protein